MSVKPQGVTQEEQISIKKFSQKFICYTKTEHRLERCDTRSLGKLEKIIIYPWWGLLNFFKFKAKVLAIHWLKTGVSIVTHATKFLVLFMRQDPQMPYLYFVILCKEGKSGALCSLRTDYIELF